MIVVSLLPSHKGRPPEDHKVITPPSQIGLGRSGELLGSLRSEKVHLTLAWSSLSKSTLRRSRSASINEVWLVTGCSSGFREQFIRSILARGDKAIAAGRDVSRLNALKEAGAAVLELDITAEQAVLVAKIQEAIGFFGGIDVLVNNVGYVSVGTLEDLP